MTKYEVTKKFLTGVLEGMTITETTTVRFTVGRVYESFTARGSSYEVLDVVEINEEAA